MSYCGKTDDQPPDELSNAVRKFGGDSCTLLFPAAIVAATAGMDTCSAVRKRSRYRDSSRHGRRARLRHKEDRVAIGRWSSITNVVCLTQDVLPVASDGAERICHHQPGVGSDVGIDRILGGARPFS
jgi:hypothetical protein